MGITANTGPLVQFGVTQTSTGGMQEYNEERGAAHLDCGHQIADPRAPYVYRPGSAVGTHIYGFWNGSAIVDCAPGTISTNALAQATQNATFASGTAIVLSSVNNSAVTINVTLTPADGSSARTVWALDSTYATAPRGLVWGQSSGGSVTSWDPTTALQRQITISRAASVDDTGMAWTIQGYDQYGYKITESITGTSSTGGSQLTSRKTYKYILSITATGTVNSTNVVVGVNDTYGFPIAVNRTPYVGIWSGQSSNMNFLTAQSSLITLACTQTQTSTTPDTRGTWASTIASNSTQSAPQRVLIWCTPAAQDVVNQSLTYSSTGYAAWLGFPQYSS